MPGVLVILFAFLLSPALPLVARGAVVDVMIVYDTTAADWVADNGGMAAFSRDAVARMNLALQNSGVNHSFRLVHSMAVNYTTTADNSTPFNSDLEQLQGGSAGFAAVHAARDSYGADLVAMMIDTGAAYGFTGIGYELSSWEGRPANGFTVSAIRSVEISHSLTHEVGHNLGADHSQYQARHPGPNAHLDGQYSAGWYFTAAADDREYHTIMAYKADGYGKTYLSAPLFSNPDIVFRGTPAGDAGAADNGRLIEQTMETVAVYRRGLVTLSGLSIHGPDRMRENGTATYSATARWSDGSSSTVRPSWSENSRYAAISAAGVLSASPAPSPQTVTVRASYTSGGITRTAEKAVIIEPERSAFSWNLFLPAIIGNAQGRR